MQFEKYKIIAPNIVTIKTNCAVYGNIKIKIIFYDFQKFEFPP